MRRLAIATATAACSVALLDGDRVAARAHEVVGRGHAERLVPMIGEVLAQAGGAVPDLVLADCGPGSFTGIRVGLAAARALGLAWNCGVAGMGAPALLAAAAGAPCCAVLAGGHGELFVQRFAVEPLRPLDAVRSLPPAVAAAEIADELLVGSGAAALAAARGWGTVLDRLPDAADAARLPDALAGLPPRPVYGRPPDAAVATRGAPPARA